MHYLVIMDCDRANWTLGNMELPITGIDQLATFVVWVVVQWDLQCVEGELIDVEFNILSIGLASSEYDGVVIRDKFLFVFLN